MYEILFILIYRIILRYVMHEIILYDYFYYQVLLNYSMYLKCHKITLYKNYYCMRPSFSSSIELVYTWSIVELVQVF